MSVLITIIGIAAVAGAVVFLWREMEEALHQLEESSEHLEAVLSSDEDAAPAVRALLKNAQRELHHHGLKTLARSAGELIVEVTRARAFSLRAKISSRIELMPQLGLLGTVFGLILTMLLSPDGLFGTLGLALFTTLEGLAAAAFAKWRVEGQADEVIAIIDSISRSDAFRRRLPERLEALEEDE